MSAWNPLKQFGVWTTILRWKEPAAFRARLNGDVWVRLSIGLAVGSLITGGLLILFAININPPPALFSLFGMLIGGGLVAIVLLSGGEKSSANVRLCEEGIVRNRTSPSLTGHFQIDELSWPYQSMGQATIVPGQSIGKSFSVLFITSPDSLEMIGVPRRIAPEQLAETLAAKGVPVQYAEEVPQVFIQPMSAVAAIAALALGLPIVIGGMVFYAGKAGGAGPIPAIAARPPAAPKMNRQPVMERGQKMAAPPAVPPIAEPQPLPGDGRRAVMQGDFDRPLGPPRMRGRGPFGPDGPSGPDGPPFGPRGPFGSGRVGPGRLDRDRMNEPPGRGFEGRIPIGPPGTVPSSAPPAKAAPPPAAGSRSIDSIPKVAVYIPPAGQPGTPTELVGGPGGLQFQTYDKDRRPVVGFRFRMGQWGPTPAVAHLDPLFDRQQRGKQESLVIGREGYVVGGLHVVAGDLVNAVRIIFVREQADGSLDKSDFYLSDWIGDPGEKQPKVLGDGKTRVIGICGRNGAVKDAIALILDTP